MKRRMYIQKKSFSSKYMYSFHWFDFNSKSNDKDVHDICPILAVSLENMDTINQMSLQFINIDGLKKEIMDKQIQNVTHNVLHLVNDFKKFNPTGLYNK